MMTQLITKNLKYLILTMILVLNIFVGKVTLGQSGSSSSNNVRDPQLRAAIGMYENNQLLNAAIAFHAIRGKPDLKPYRGYIYLTLGKILLELKFPQIAAWQFANVLIINDEKYNKRALELLMTAADQLNDETILNYAVSKMKVSDFPASQKDMLFFRVGEIKFRNKDYKSAADIFNRVAVESDHGEMALYMSGTSYSMMNQLDIAIGKFDTLLSSQKRPVTNDTRVSTLMALARAYYQKKEWEKSLDYYRKVPRDHWLWHAALFESAWSDMRGGRFRSALGNFQSLHSSYYDDFYVPESLVLRAIVYLYICKYEEVTKVLNLYDSSYGDLQTRLSNYLRSTTDPKLYYDEIERGLQNKKLLQEERKISEGRLPYKVVRSIIGKPDIERGLDYLRKLYEEKKRLDNMPRGFSDSALGQYSTKLLIGRLKTAQKIIGTKAKIHMMVMKGELKDLEEQVAYMRYEMIGMQKELLQKKMAGQTPKESQIDEDSDRSYYVKNGYEYWPFQGEFWLDEIGNYFYIGKQSCGK